MEIDNPLNHAGLRPTPRALKGNDGLALGADSRGTFGDPRATTAQNDSQEKAHILARHVGGLVAVSSERQTLPTRSGRRELAAE
jgi:hypothetical protein